MITEWRVAELVDALLTYGLREGCRHVERCASVSMSTYLNEIYISEATSVLLIVSAPAPYWVVENWLGNSFQDV